jgi:hypothetical protein
MFFNCSISGAPGPSINGLTDTQCTGDFIAVRFSVNASLHSSHFYVACRGQCCTHISRRFLLPNLTKIIRLPVIHIYCTSICTYVPCSYTSNQLYVCTYVLLVLVMATKINLHLEPILRSRVTGKIRSSRQYSELPTILAIYPKVCRIDPWPLWGVAS